jgi:hypothetical protein
MLLSLEQSLRQGEVPWIECAIWVKSQILQVLRRQVRQDRFVNLVLAEGPLLPFEAEAPQPTPEVHEGVLTTRQTDMILEAIRRVHSAGSRWRSLSGQVDLVALARLVVGLAASGLPETNQRPPLTQRRACPLDTL